MTRTKALLVVLVVVAASAAYADLSVWALTGEVTRNQHHNTRALCSLRDDLQKRADSGSRFLATHPNGIPGVPAATLRVGIANEQSTLKALKPLVC